MSVPALDKAMLVACDCLQPVAACLGIEFEGTRATAAEAAAYWHQRVTLAWPSLLVVGTSDSSCGRAIEAGARIAARTADVPVAAVEDFPGNYGEIADAKRPSCWSRAKLRAISP